MHKLCSTKETFPRMLLGSLHNFLRQAAAEEKLPPRHRGTMLPPPCLLPCVLSLMRRVLFVPNGIMAKKFNPGFILLTTHFPHINSSVLYLCKMEPGMDLFLWKKRLLPSCRYTLSPKDRKKTGDLYQFSFWKDMRKMSILCRVFFFST